MHAAALTADWVVLVIGLACTTAGVATLVRDAPVLPRLTRELGVRRTGRILLLQAAFFLLETVPRVAGATSAIVLALSVVAFAPLCVAVALARSAPRQPEP